MVITRARIENNLIVPTAMSKPLPSMADEAIERIARHFTSEPLPAARARELYQIRCLAGNGVAFATEFMYLFDFGFECLAGMSVFHHVKGMGDPDFPDFDKGVIRSCVDRTSRELIYPMVAGFIMFDADPAVSHAQLEKDLSPFLFDLDLSSQPFSGRCRLFRERTTAAAMKKAIPYLRYAEPNHVLRLIDYVPGWTVNRLL